MIMDVTRFISNKKLTYVSFKSFDHDSYLYRNKFEDYVDHILYIQYTFEFLM